MGMFDDIRVEYPLPLPEYQDNAFQTKDLDCALYQYVITKEGRLMRSVVEYDVVPAEERRTRWSPIFRPREDTRRMEDTNHHGDIWFYDIPERGGWVEFRARFTDGTLTTIEVVEDEPAGAANAATPEES